MNILERPSLVFDHRISDLREHTSQVNINVEMRQLDAGKSRARIAMMATSKVAVMRGEYERAYHKIGEAPRNTLSIGVPDADVGEFRWCGKVASGNKITNFGLESGFDGQSAPGFAGFVFSIHHDFLQETCEMLEFNVDFRKLISQDEVFPHSEPLVQHLRFRAHSALNSLRNSDGSDAVEFLCLSASELILGFLAKGWANEPKSSRKERCRATKVIREYLEDADTLPLTVAELCTKNGVSAPTLYRAFQDEFGVGPKQYMQFRRLNGVRDLLLRKSDRSSIVDAANTWGFWHMGQFAADYRRHFGELPSRTQASARSGRHIATPRQGIGGL